MRRYLTQHQLEAIQHESYEWRRQRIMEAIDAFEGQAESKIARPSQLVATFTHHAVVAASDGTLYRYDVATTEGVCIRGRAVYDGMRSLSETEAGKDPKGALSEAAKAVLEGRELNLSAMLRSEVAK